MLIPSIMSSRLEFQEKATDSHTTQVAAVSSDLLNDVSQDVGRLQAFLECPRR